MREVNNFSLRVNSNRVLAILLLIMGTAHLATAQVWIPVTHASGTQVINGRTVRVTSEGSVRTEATFARCGATPYTIGINYNGIPGSFTFHFSPATSTVRFFISATNIGEVNSFYINGSHYLLTAANLQPLPTCAPQTPNPLSVQGGNVIFAGPVVPNVSYGNMGSGIVEINFPAGIDSIRIHNNGVQGGSTFGFSYWGFYAEAHNDSACHGEPLHLYGIPSDPRVSYQWTGPNGFVSNDQNPVLPNASALMDGPYVLRTVFNVDTAYDTTYVRTRPLPAKPTISGDSVVCRGTNTILRAASSTAGAGFLWDGPNNYRSVTNAANIRNARERDTGVYSVVSTLNGCSSSPANVRLRINYPTKGDTIPVQVCQGGSYNFYGITITTEGVHAHTLPKMSSNGCDSITYIALSFTPPPTDTQEVSICTGGSYVFNNSIITEPGYYKDTLKSNGGCDSIVVLHLKLNPALQGEFEVGICEGDHYAFAGKQLSTPGIYFDTVKTAGGCDSIISLKLNVRPLPTVVASVEGNNTPCLGDTVHLNGEGGDRYIWSLNGNQIGTDATVSFVALQADNQITLQAFTDDACSDSTHLAVSAIPCCNIFVPNAFTPNGDGKNDQFRVYSESRIIQYRLDIMNRFGQLVYTSGDPTQGWDGTINGTAADVGTYFYQIKGKCLSGTEIYQKGDLTIIR